MSVEVIVKARYKDDEHVWIDGKLFIRLSRVNKMMLELGHRLTEEGRTKRGTWIRDGKIGTYCSRCGFGVADDVAGLINYLRYCPNCGTEMENEYDRRN